MTLWSSDFHCFPDWEAKTSVLQAHGAGILFPSGLTVRFSTSFFTWIFLLDYKVNIYPVIQEGITWVLYATRSYVADWRDSIVGVTLALYSAHPVSIPSTPMVPWALSGGPGVTTEHCWIWPSNKTNQTKWSSSSPLLVYLQVRRQLIEHVYPTV